MNLEHELKEALKRQQPPPGMAERVIAKLNAQEPLALAPSFWRSYRAGFQLAAAAALIVVVGMGVVRQREASREQQQSEAAAKQLMTALKIASETLNRTRQVVGQ